jgi:hypothetical protein
MFLTGCTTIVPVKVDFPKAPDTLKQKCSELSKVKDQANLSDIAKIVSDNYTKYHECSMKNDSWIDWYETQKKIFDGVK